MPKHNSSKLYKIHIHTQMFTLRIIKQLEGATAKYNSYLGKQYDVYSRAPKKQNQISEFEKIESDYFKDQDHQNPDPKIFVTDFIVDQNEKYYPIFNNNKAYIVGLDGHTVERVR